MPTAPALQLQDLNRRQDQLQRLNRILLGLLPLGVLLLGWDLFHSISELRSPVEPVPPSLEELRGSSEAVPPLQLSEVLFSIPQPAAQASKTSASVSRPSWKVKGILMGNARRALLEDPEKKESLWVTEGQQAGPYKVQQIKERSVLLESEGALVEISI